MKRLEEVECAPWVDQIRAAQRDLRAYDANHPLLDLMGVRGERVLLPSEEFYARYGSMKSIGGAIQAYREEMQAVSRPTTGQETFDFSQVGNV